ncbi:cytochrome P450 (plasmid) [Mycobacterium branderi]|uniref:Cytochrome P450 n=1 Tax=Mycobacterium branderi TaxID=43348 RepID=A0ABN6BHT6_9MYCO|nr:cytochrome P450 [Mycobacterium branderi]
MNATTTNVSIDLWSSASFANGHPVHQYHWLQENAPVYWHDEPGGAGFWAVTTAGLVKEASVRPQIFSNRFGMTMYDVSETELSAIQHMMMFMDPPRHTQYRKLVSSEFTPRSAARWASLIDRLADEIIDQVCEAGECELMSQVAGLLPSYLVAELLGVPRRDGIRLYELTEVMHSAQDAVSDEQRAAAREEMLQFGTDLRARKVRQPDESLASRLVHAEVDGHRLDDLDFNLFILLLVNAGGDTVRNLVGGAMLTLFEHPDAKSRLIADIAGLMPRAVEEFLRYQSPVVFMRRTALQDTRLGAVNIAAGEKVLLYFGAANRDPAVFADPDDFIVDRHPNPHMGFGAGGPHFCLGAHFARLEISAMMSRLLTRLPNLELVGEPTWLASNFISGPTEVNLRFTPSLKGVRY